MNLWFLDASVSLARADPEDQNHIHTRRLLEGSEPLATLDLAWYEVTNVAVGPGGTLRLPDASSSDWRQWPATVG